MDTLDSLRGEIDKIDKELTELFEKRVEIILKIADYKKQNNIPILSKEREEEVIERNEKYLKNKALKSYHGEFFENIMSISRKIQARKIFDYNMDLEDDRKGKLEYIVSRSGACSPKRDNIKVGFQGVHGSFSQEALTKYFGSNVKTLNVKEFEDVFKALSSNEIDYGVLPIENSSTGGIADVYDLLRKYGFFIVGERIIKVSHNLLGIKGAKIEDIKEVYSHTQALQQSREFFRSYPDMKLVPYSNTAASAKYIKMENKKEKAAIASKKAAKIYDLDILKADINYNKHNYTRFIVIGKNLELGENYDKISIVLSLPHKAGALYNILSIFAEYNLNLLKIESRPIVDKSFEYFFYIDFEGNLERQLVKEALIDVRNNSYDFKLLGNYKSHSINED